MPEIRLNHLLDLTDRADEMRREDAVAKQRQVLLQRRANRIARRAKQYGHDELAMRYAWSRVLFIELEHLASKLSKLSDADGALISQQKFIAAIYKGRADGHSEAARQFAGEINKTRKDRQKGPAVRDANSAIQAAKKEAKKLFLEWKDGKHKKLHTNIRFAEEAMRRWPVLKSEMVIRGWCSAWNKEPKKLVI
jgi:hypothetical protein